MSQAVAKNTLVYTGGLILQKVLAFGFNLLVARLLGVDGNGRVFAAVTFAMMFAVVADLGVTNIFIREGANKPEERQGLFSQSFTLRILNGILMIAATNLTAWALGYDMNYRELILIASISSFFESIQVLFFAALRTAQNLKYEAGVLFLGQVVQMIAGVTLLLLWRSPYAVVTALVICNIWNVGASWFMMRKTLGIKLQFAYGIRALFAFGKMALPFTLAGIFVKIYSYVGGVMLSRLSGDFATGLFGSAYKFTYAFQFIPLAFVAGLYPAFSSLYKRDEQGIVKLFERAEWYMASIAFPLVAGVLAVSEKLVPLLFGPHFAPAVGTMNVLFPVLAFIFLEFPIASLLNATHHQNKKTFFSGIVVIINVGLNILLIPTLLDRGAAIADVVSFAAMFFMGLAVALRVFPISLKRLLMIYARPLLASAVMYLAVVGVKSLAGIIVAIPVGIVVYVVTLFLVRGVTREDIGALKSLIKRSPVPPPEGDAPAV
jgi:O-antigen/teichoic acid export membrane protein